MVNVMVVTNVLAAGGEEGIDFLRTIIIIDLEITITWKVPTSRVSWENVSVRGNVVVEEWSARVWVTLVDIINVRPSHNTPPSPIINNRDIMAQEAEEGECRNRCHLQ